MRAPVLISKRIGEHSCGVYGNHCCLNMCSLCCYDMRPAGCSVVLPLCSSVMITVFACRVQGPLVLLLCSNPLLSSLAACPDHFSNSVFSHLPVSSAVRQRPLPHSLDGWSGIGGSCRQVQQAGKRFRCQAKPRKVCAFASTGFQVRMEHQCAIVPHKKNEKH